MSREARYRLGLGLLLSAFVIPVVHVLWLLLGYLSIQGVEPSLIHEPVPASPWSGISQGLAVINLLLPGAVLFASLRSRLSSPQRVALLWSFGLVYACWSACWIDLSALH